MGREIYFEHEETEPSLLGAPLGTKNTSKILKKNLGMTGFRKL